MVEIRLLFLSSIRFYSFANERLLVEGKQTRAVACVVTLTLCVFSR